MDGLAESEVDGGKAVLVEVEDVGETEDISVGVFTAVSGASELVQPARAAANTRATENSPQKRGLKSLLRFLQTF